MEREAARTEVARQDRGDEGGRPDLERASAATWSGDDERSGDGDGEVRRDGGDDDLELEAERRRLKLRASAAMKMAGGGSEAELIRREHGGEAGDGEGQI